jgi:hypothetical protein
MMCYTGTIVRGKWLPRIAATFAHAGPALLTSRQIRIRVGACTDRDTESVLALLRTLEEGHHIVWLWTDSVSASGWQLVGPLTHERP